MPFLAFGLISPPVLARDQADITDDADGARPVRSLDGQEMPVGQTAADLGSKLHYARERSGVSLRQIANSTKISISILEALESNDISRLPGGVYGRGFVRSFATEVGLDPEAAVAEFIAQFQPVSIPPEHPTTERNEKDEGFETDPLIGPSLSRLIAVGIPIAALVFYFGLHFATKGRGRERAPVKPSARSATVPKPLTLPPPPSPSQPSDGASTAAAPPAPRSAIAPEVAQADTEPSAETKTSETSGVGEAVDNHLTVALSVTRPSWVIATVDGKKTLSRLFQVGEQETLEARQALVLTAGDAGAIVMTINGADARVLGGDGETVTARVNRTNFKNYLALR